MRAIRIPADGDPIAIVEVGSDWRKLAATIGRGCQYIERAHCLLTPAYGWVIVVDEEGQFRPEQPPNNRAHALYPLDGYILAGDVLVLNEGMTSEGADFVDFEDADAALAVVKRVCS